jgi:hypothetical protein
MTQAADRRLEQSVECPQRDLEHKNGKLSNQNQFRSPLALLLEKSSSLAQ